MPQLTVLPSNKVIDAAAGQTLLQALLAGGEALQSKCNGQARCGACHVFVKEGRKGISRISPAENAKLDSIVGVGAKSRLACQAVLGEEPVTVELLGALSGF
ncbi:2Fe-2S iron-sulfur cluster-binding protein [Azohydromonas aeria]|uniref:2Fe-2S iron-sulfur cluster-binding protein n=1 Tax=Azohydromonas aeria TaxID=2590212 RepID=UPI0012FAB5FD|nr:2Fe-2S iron-sulfur cluster-binding protein [Azohydromonas aeria]